MRRELLLYRSPQMLRGWQKLRRGCNTRQRGAGWEMLGMTAEGKATLD